MIRKSLVDGMKNSFSTILFIAKIILPVMFVVKILEEINFVYWFSNTLEPLMSLFSLNGDTALTLLLGNFINIYAAIATFETINVTTTEVTVIAIMLLISHSQITEGFVFKKLGVSLSYIISIRVVSAIVVGWIVSVIIL